MFWQSVCHHEMVCNETIYIFIALDRFLLQTYENNYTIPIIVFDMLMYGIYCFLNITPYKFIYQHGLFYEHLS